MSSPTSINYNPLFSEEDLTRRIRNLSNAVSAALGPLQYWEDHEQCGANDIADNEAKYVQEIMGFLYLFELVEQEELPGAVKSVNKALWEIEMARQIGGIEVNHPWKGEAFDRSYETLCSSFFKGFDYLNYASTPEDEVIRDQSHDKEVRRDQKIDPLDPLAGF
jgi:hypothetical protein